MPRGHERPLYILPFDHRGSFETNMFGWKGELNDAEFEDDGRSTVARAFG